MIYAIISLTLIVQANYFSVNLSVDLLLILNASIIGNNFQGIKS